MEPKADSSVFSLKNLSYALVVAVILYLGRSILVPLAFAMLLSFILYPLCAWMERRRIGKTTAIALSVGLLSILILAVAGLLTTQFLRFIKEWPSLHGKLSLSLQQAIQWIASTFDLSGEDQQKWIAKGSDAVLSGTISLLQEAITTSATSAVMMILIPVYTVLLLYHRTTWMEVLYRLFPASDRSEVRTKVIMIVHTYYNFIKGMGIVYLAVGVLNATGLLLLGVPHAILFGFIASVLTFIPYVGIIVGSLLPVSMAWVATDSIWYPMGVVAVFVFVQYLEANVIFPFAVSSKLNVNTLVVLVAIFAGGLLWGVSGMILFVPFTGILKLFAETNPSLETLSLLLGSKK